MDISKKVWKRYINGLAKVDNLAKDKMMKYIESHDVNTEAGREALIAYAYGISTKYGEAAAEFACQMYDSEAELEGYFLPPSEPAETATYDEVAKAVYGTLKYALQAEMVGTAVGRLVKQAGQDTTLKNAIRDKAYYAWIPSGDTCAFCLSIAAEGWQRATAQALAGGHADHIHGNCDCAYGIKHDEKMRYSSYNAEQYEKILDNAEGDDLEEKLNSIRRANYARNKKEINEQKRIAYGKRVELLNASAAEEMDVN